MDDSQEKPRSRIQFDFTPEALSRLEAVQEKIGASTKAEVIRNALKLYDLFANEFKPDYIVEVKDEEGNTIFKTPARVLLF